MQIGTERASYMRYVKYGVVGAESRAAKRRADCCRLSRGGCY